VFTKRAGVETHPVELGAEWLDAHSLIPDLVRASGGTVHEAHGRYLARMNGDIVEWNEEPDERLMRRLTTKLRDDRALTDVMRERCAGDEWALAREYLIRYVEGFHAADPAQLSVQWLRDVEATQSADASQLRADDGLDLAARALRPEHDSRCEMRLSTVVTAVGWRRGEVVVSVHPAESPNETGEIRGDVAVITLPLSILRLSPEHPSAVRFTPSLDARRPAFDGLATGDVIKVVFDFDAPFWNDDAATRDMLFLFDWTQRFPTCWTQRPQALARLTTWAGGPQVRRLGEIRGEALAVSALQSLAGMFGRTSEELERAVVGVHLHDWRDDPHALGAYSWVRSGGVDAHRVLAQPLQDALFFAGEATCGEGFNATVRGAAESGRRAADEILAAHARLAH
jgi:monoamine oxidase